MKKEIPKIRIIIDKMEFPGGIPKLFEKISGVDTKKPKLEIDMDFQILQVADYIVSDHCAIERKFKDDFFGSLIGDEKGKIFRQVRDLVAAYNPQNGGEPILLIECDQVDLFSSRNIHPNAIWAVLQFITEKGCSIRFTSTAEGTAKYLVKKALEEQYGKTTLFNPHGSKTKMNPAEAKEYIISAIQDVGPATARKLLLHFKTIERIIQATELELSMVPGVGLLTAQKIRQIITEEYK